MLCYISKALSRKLNMFVLGFYDRGNLGDECYKTSFRRIFKNYNLRFQCSDDTLCIPPDTDIVVVGGGDVINTYFMSKILLLLRQHTGPVYAFSVGIPYESDGLKYLHVFDHVFLRNKHDYDLACKEIGTENVSYCPDASMALPTSIQGISFGIAAKKIGVCLAQPLFNKDPDRLLESLCEGLSRLPDGLEIHLLPFNTSENERESDTYINKKAHALLCSLGLNVYNREELTTTTKMQKAVASMDLMVCMRYHSVMFSVLQKRRFLPIYTSNKIDHVLKDLVPPPVHTYKLPSDEHDYPVMIDSDLFFSKIKAALNDTSSVPGFKNADFREAARLICIGKKKKLMIKNSIDKFEHVLLNCKRVLTHYLGTIDYETVLYQKGRMPIEKHKPEDVARLITYVITGYVQNDYVWGLSHNLQKDGFCLFDAIDYIWKDMNQTRDMFVNSSEHYYPSLNIERKVFVNLDYIFQNNFASYHRSGWAYAIGGLMNIDGHSLDRHPRLLLDTYVDRSFHWGLDTLCEIGILPYKQPWLGFVHHTFDETHSTYNCQEMFKNPVFLESLKSCKGLISLTCYLAGQLKKALENAGFAKVSVNVVYHPMEFVQNMFTMDRFLKNKDKKVVQIGAWLRNPYGIYDLPLYKEWKNPMGFRKCALKGKDMNQYFKPNTLFNDIEALLIREYNTEYKNDNEESIGRVCRDSMCRPNGVNKYCRGLYDTIIQKDNSVSVLEKLNNDEYDALLSENVVFLDLVDCSAVNTVLEILVRNTPLIVNRHPAVEEILGKHYPGFYANLTDAASMLGDPKKISDMTNYLKKLDKTRYRLDSFVNDVQKLCTSKL